MSLRKRNALPAGDPYCDSKTEYQWMILGFVPKDGAYGELMWSNAFCKCSTEYFRPDEVRPATNEEKESFQSSQREKQRLAADRRKELNQRKEEERKRHNDWVDSMLADIERWEADGKVFYEETIANNKQFVMVLLHDESPRGTYLLYIAPPETKEGDPVTVPLGFFNTPTPATVISAGYSFEDISRLGRKGSFPEWFDGTKEILAMT